MCITNVPWDEKGECCNCGYSTEWPMQMNNHMLNDHFEENKDGTIDYNLDLLREYLTRSAGRYLHKNEYYTGHIREIGIHSTILTILTGLVYFILPIPHNFIAMLAMCGPNSVCFLRMFRSRF